MLNGKTSLLHKNFDFLKNAVRNFNVSFTIFTLILIMHKSFKRKYWLDFPFYSVIFSTMIILKPALESINSDLQSQGNVSQKIFFGNSCRSMQPSTWSISSLPRLLYCNLCIERQKLLCILPYTLIIWWYKFKSWSYTKQPFPVILETFWK